MSFDNVEVIIVYPSVPFIATLDLLHEYAPRPERARGVGISFSPLEEEGESLLR
jgi:hypothetical protein